MTEWKYEQDGLVITVSRTGSKAVVVWKGISDARSPGTFLNPVTEQLVEKLKNVDVAVDFTQLEYMNSATVGPVIGLIKSLDTASKSVLVLFSDADWQKTHLKCMSAIGRTLQHVRVEGRTVRVGPKHGNAGTTT